MKRKLMIAILTGVLLVQAAALPIMSVNAAEDEFVIEETVEVNSKLSSETIPLGGSVTVKASEADDSEGYTYAVYYKKQSETGWKTAQAFSENSEVAVKPAKATTYDVCVKAKNEAGKLVRREVFSFNVIDDFELSAEITSEQISLGNKVVVTSASSGGVGEHKYAFFYRRSDDTKWTCVQSYDSNFIKEITPKRAGDFELCVKAKDESGRISKTYKQFTVSDDLNVTTEYTSDNIKLGQTAEINVVAEGGSGGYAYAFYYKKASDNGWKMVSHFTDSNEFSFKPAKAGSYDVCVKVKDSSGRVRKEYTTLSVTDDLTVDYELSSDAILSGSDLAVTVSSEGGVGTHTYAVYYVLKSEYEANPQLDWNCVQHFETANEVTINQPATGDYYICVKVKDENGVVRKTEYGTFKVVEPVEASVSFKNNRKTVFSDTSVTVNLSVSGGTGEYTYDVFYKSATAEEWTEYSKDQTGSSFVLQGVLTRSFQTENMDLKIVIKDACGIEKEVTDTFMAAARAQYELPFVPNQP